MVSEDVLIENLKEVYDPEMPTVNIYDLGLIYNIEINEFHVKITHTLTSPMCPFAEYIMEMIHEAATNAGAQTVELDLTFDPPFTMDMVPDETKFYMGWDW